GADDVDHQRLRGQRLDEPAGMKERLAGSEEMKQYVERQEVKNGADGTDVQHEAADQADIPLARCPDKVLIDVVGGNGELRKVVKEVVKQDLHRQHWQGRQESRGASPCEHVTKVRTGPHEQVLHHVAEGLATLEDAARQHLESRFDQDDVRRLARHVY